MSVRKRPVITVVEARPMNEVGFRDAKTTASVPPEAPKTVAPVPKNPPVARPVPVNNNAAMERNPNPVAQQKPVPAARKPTELMNSLDLDDQMKKFPNHAPPKPRRTNPVRPVTMHFDEQNNIIADEQKSRSGNPVPVKRLSVHADRLSNDNGCHGSHLNSDTNDSWKRKDWMLEESSLTRSKPEAAPRKPTIIRASTYESKTSGKSVPPHVAPKSSEVKQHAAELLQTTEAEDTTGAKNYVKPAAKPKPMVKPKLESKSELDETESKSERPDVRKRPTVIRPSLDRRSSVLGNTTTENTVSVDKNAGVEIPICAKVTPTIIRPGFISHESSVRHSKISLDQEESVCTQSEMLAIPLQKSSTMENMAKEQSRKHPNVVRPKVEPRCKDLSESSVSISSDRSTVHFSATRDGVQLEERGTRASVDLSERQNAENWKRMEMEGSQMKAPARPAVPPVQDPFKVPPLKPPPSHSGKLCTQGSNDIQNMMSQPSSETQPRQGPPPRPAVGPTKVNKSAPQSSKRDQFSSGLGPSLPRRPTLGHPLFHYVATGPHAIALFEYQPTQADELAFKASEVIILEKWINSEWLYGRTARASGMFPATFVDIIQPPPRDLADSLTVPASVPKPDSSLPAPLPGSGPRCVARFDYNGEDSSDLAFVEGDVIQILERIGDEWMKGELNKKKGMFPVSFVEIIEDLPAAEDKFVPSSLQSDESSVLVDFLNQQPSELNPLSKEKPHCIALYDFPAQNSDDLSFSAGDKIILLDRINDDWLRGEIHDKTGIFPSSFVRIVKDLVCHDNKPHSQSLHVDQQPSVEPSLMSAADLACDINVETSTKATKTAVAVYDFPGETPDDLKFRVGDVIEITGTVNDEWMEGKMNGKSGIFPSAFVKIAE